MSRCVFLLAALALLTAPAARAQVVWDAPALLRPGAPAGLSVFLISAHPGDGLGALATWRNDAAPTGLGFRLGIAEEREGDAAVLFGVDVSGPLTGVSGEPGVPDVIWWTGAGVGVGDEVAVSFPLGISAGWLFSDEGVNFMPFVGAHIALDVVSGPGDDLDLDGALDLGVDLGFPSGITVRFGASLADRDALAVGLRLPIRG